MKRNGSNEMGYDVDWETYNNFRNKTMKEKKLRIGALSSAPENDIKEIVEEKKMEGITEEFIQQMFLAVLRVAFNVREAAFINSNTAISFKLPDTKEVKYVIPQFFNYDTKKFVCNRETFKGEIGVMIITNTYATIFNAKDLKDVLSLHEKEVSKNKHGDWEIDFKFVKGVARKIAEV